MELAFGLNYKVDFGAGDYTAIQDSVILTRSELKGIIGDAYKAGHIRCNHIYHIRRTQAKLNNIAYPNKEEYINSILKQ